MENVPIELIAEMQAQIDELQGRLLDTLTNADDLASAMWEIATTVEYLIEDVSRDGHAKSRLLQRITSAIDTIEDVMGVRE